MTNSRNSNPSQKPTGKLPMRNNNNYPKAENRLPLPRPNYNRFNSIYGNASENEVEESKLSLEEEIVNPYNNSMNIEDNNESTPEQTGGSRKFKNGRKSSHRSRQSKKHKSKHLKNNSKKRKSKKRV